MIEKEIRHNRNCMGCYACENICSVNAITMTKDNEGFMYPKVNYSKCTKCGKCIKVCPIINNILVKNDTIAYACINNDESIRLKSSSGGVFTMLAEQVIDNGGVVYGAAFDANFQLKHCYVDSKNDLEKLRGSKYLQSQIGSTYKQAKGFLDSGRKVLFSGTPCQIAGFKSYLIKSYENLLTIDIICHGVPSPKVWEKYIEFRQHKAGSLAKSVSFRDKSEGWKQSSIAFLFNDNEKYRENLRNDLYMKAFLNNICLRPSCYECQFKTLNRQSDITLADFWGIVNIIPELDDDKGTSLVFVNSNRGKIFFENILTEAKFKEVNINKALEYNSAAIESAKNNSNRNSFFADLERLKFDKLVKKYCTEKLYIRVKNKEKIIIRRFLHKVGLLSIVKKLLESVNQILCKGDSTL